MLIALFFLFSIPRPSAFPWPDINPLVAELEANRTPDDLVVVGNPLRFNYALSAPQTFTTKVSDRTPTHFTPAVQGVNVMNWQDYGAPMTEFKARLRGVGIVWLLDAPNVIYPLGDVPRAELANLGFHLENQDTSNGAVLEQWQRGS